MSVVGNEMAGKKSCNFNEYSLFPSVMSCMILFILMSGCLGLGSNDIKISEGEIDMIINDNKNLLNNTSELNNIDTDLDGILNYLDMDDDGDGILDSEDHFPLDNEEYLDSDLDGIGNNFDSDDDNDGWLDDVELACSSNSTNRLIVPEDKDGDKICDTHDPDFEGILRNFKFLGANKDFNLYAGENAELYAMNMTSWQIEHGGWEKWNKIAYQSEWDGNSSRSFYTSNGIELGSLADKATTGEIRYLSSAYANSTNENNKSTIKMSVELGINFVLNSQHDSGGWPQVYPNRTCSGCNYTSLMTYNDFVIPNVLLLLHDIKEGIYPFDNDIGSNFNFTKINTSIDAGINFIIKSQIIANGNHTIWGQQHDPYTFQSLSGRSYELECKASAESAGMTLVLLNWKNRTSDINNATWSSVKWFEENAIYGYSFDPYNGSILESKNSLMWYRYYNVSDDQYFMAGRDGIKVYYLNDLTEERRTGYRWASNWAQGIIEETSKLSNDERIMYFKII